MSKRRRTTTGFVRVKRPTAKDIISIGITNAGTTQRATVLKTTTFPCTFTGLRWSLSFQSVLTSGPAAQFWAIVLNRDGETSNTLVTSDGSSLYTPEQNVLAWGHWHATDADIGQGPSIMKDIGDTKTMRKLQEGDTMDFITIGTAGTANLVRGAIQFFCKS